MSEQKTVKLEIEIHAIPADKIPAGMKLGNPAYEKRIAKYGNICLFADEKWRRIPFGQIGLSAIVANFVPIEPEEKDGAK